MKNFLKSIFKKSNHHDELLEHISGATVKHKSKFSELTIIENEQVLDEKFINKFVTKFYLKRPSNNEFIVNYKRIENDITTEVVKQLLGDRNWRTRRVGAIYSAIKGFDEYFQNIGNLLLRSDLCYAGESYCIALVSLNSNKSITIIKDYLDYYLKQKDKWFDQGVAIAALKYLGEIHNENYHEKYIPLWNDFITDKENWNLEETLESFKEELNSVKNLSV